MSTPNLSPKRKRVNNNNPHNDESAAERNRRYELTNAICKTIGERICNPHCHPFCGYARYAGTKLCTNPNCEHAAQKCSALDVSQFLSRYPKPELFHGRSWGKWTLDTERLTLVLRGSPQVRGGEGTGVPMYVGFFGEREIDLEDMTSSAKVLDAIFQTQSAVSNEAMTDLLAALDDVLEPQVNLCSCGRDKRIENPGEFLRGRL